MFSKAKRFNYPESKDLSPSTTVCSRNHPIHTPRKRPFPTSPSDSVSTPKKRTRLSQCNAKSTPKRRNSEDVENVLSNLHNLEAKMQNRCQELDHLAASTSASESSSRTSTPPVQEIQAGTVVERSQHLELCETIAALVYQKMKGKKEENLWQKGKAFWKNTKKVIADLVK